MVVRTKMAVLRHYSWLCNQWSLLVILGTGGTICGFGVWGGHQTEVYHLQGNLLTSCALSLVLVLILSFCSQAPVLVTRQNPHLWSESDSILTLFSLGCYCHFAFYSIEEIVTLGWIPVTVYSQVQAKMFPRIYNHLLPSTWVTTLVENHCVGILFWGFYVEPTWNLIVWGQKMCHCSLTLAVFYGAHLLVWLNYSSLSGFICWRQKRLRQGQGGCGLIINPQSIRCNHCWWE